MVMTPRCYLHHQIDALLCSSPFIEVYTTHTHTCTHDSCTLLVMTLLVLCYIVSRQGAVTCASNLAPACLAPAGGRKRRRPQHGRLGQRHASLSSIEGATHDSGSTAGPPEADAAFDGSKDKKKYWTTCSNGDLGEEFVVLKLYVDLQACGVQCQCCGG